MKPIYLSLGANLGDPMAQIRQALQLLQVAGCEVLRVSSLYKTAPVDVLDQPWFVNCAAECETNLSPSALLHVAKAIERSMGRIRRKMAHGPREIDIDILYYGKIIVERPSLSIPHPRIERRRFVLVPFDELAPDFKHPMTNKTASVMLRETADRSKVIRLKKQIQLSGTWSDAKGKRQVLQF